jgi:hypothetical protein
MSRSCARPTCARPAVATLSYSYAESVAELDPLIDVAHPMVHDLCRTHADNVSVPRGWTLRDRFSDTAAGVDPAGRPNVQLDLIGA